MINRRDSGHKNIMLMNETKQNTDEKGTRHFSYGHDISL